MNILSQTFHLLISSLHNNRRSSLRLFRKTGVSQYYQENTSARVSFFINILAGQELQSILIKDGFLALIFSRQLYKIFHNFFNA